MRFGIVTQGYIRNDSNVYDRVRQVILEAQAAEHYGLDFFGVSEQHLKFPTNSTGATEVILSWVAATTERLRLQPGAVIPVLHHPLNIAERWATIDILSGGRVDFAVGRGNTPKTADAFQVPIGETHARTVESLEIIVKAWTKEEFSHDGEFFTFDTLRVNPRPLQSPHPPLSLAAVSVGAAAMAGSLRLGFMGTTNNLEWHQVQERLDAYHSAWDEGATIVGAAPNATVNLHVPCHLAATVEQASSEVEFGIIEYTNRAMKQDILNHQRTYGSAKGMDTTGQFYDNFAGLRDLTPMCVGTVEESVEKLVRLHLMGVDEIGLVLDYATHEQLLECIRLIGEELIPRVRQEIGQPEPLSSGATRS